MIINQRIVDKIVDLAKFYGASDGLTHKNYLCNLQAYSSDMITHKPAEVLARLLVEGYDDKEDLCLVFKAAFEVMYEESKNPDYREYTTN